MGYCRDAAGKSEMHKDTIKGRREKNMLIMKLTKNESKNFK